MKKRFGVVLLFMFTFSLITPFANASVCVINSECLSINNIYRKLDGTNSYRVANSLIMYDRTNGQTVSPANPWGYEASVVNGVVTAVRDYMAGMPIPVSGYVLSGHGTEYSWLKANATVGSVVTLPGGSPLPPPPVGGLPLSGSWTGQYWDNATLTGAPVVTRQDAKIDFNVSGAVSLAAGQNGSDDSERWTQASNFPTGDYTFSVTGDDGIRLKLDGALVINGWVNQSPTTYTAVRNLTGVHTVVVEHYEKYGDETAKFVLTGGAVTPPPVSLGRWTVNSIPMPLRAMHSTLLRDGRVLLIAGSGNNESDFQAGTFKSAVWNPVTNVFTNVSVPEDMFCSNQVTLPDGRVLIQGGTASYAGSPPGEAFRGLKSSYIFDPATLQYTKTNDTIEGHWYPTMTKIENGDIWAAGGYTHKAGGGASTSTEMFNSVSGVWKTALQVPQTNRYLGTYPHMFLMADGRLFYTGGHTFGEAQPGTGSFIYDWRTASIGDVSGLRNAPLRDQAGSVLLPPAQNQKFMIVGGGSTDNGGATNSVDIIDMKQSVPSWFTGPALPGVGRMYLNLTTLPDRTVLASNGATGNRTGNVMLSSIYNPASNSWASVNADPVGRNYHSSTILLQDGRVAVFGSNPADGSYDLRVSLFEPPYLFKGTAPTITSAPINTVYGAQISLGVTGNVVSASLRSPSTSTHQTDTNQRLVDLPIVGTGTTRTASVPFNSALLPPGPYMLTVLDDNGVPSTAKWVNVR